MEKVKHNINSKEVQSIRWVARLIGFIPCIFYLIYFSGSMDDLKLAITTGYDSEVIIPILTLLSAGLLGYIISWFKEMYGGAIMIVIGIAVFFYLYHLQGWDNKQGMALYAGPFVLSGLLFISCWRRDAKIKRSKAA